MPFTNIIPAQCKTNITQSHTKTSKLICSPPLMEKGGDINFHFLSITSSGNSPGTMNITSSSTSTCSPGAPNRTQHNLKQRTETLVRLSSKVFNTKTQSTTGRNKQRQRFA